MDYKDFKVTKNTKRNIGIAFDKLNGMTYRELSKKYGIKDASISYALNKAEIKDCIETALNHLVSFAPIVVRNYRQLLESKNENTKLKATMALSQILGLTPSHTTSQVHNLYIQQNNINQISDGMRSIIGKLSGKQDFVDAEFEDILDK